MEREADSKKMSLIDRCKSKMSSSLLRLMDESLYTSDATEVGMDEERFNAYHDAYEKVRANWPVQPVDHIVKFIKRRLSKQKPIQKIKFADIGCGRQPLLRMKLGPKAKVKSYDLVSVHKDVIQANMESIPLEDETIHCAVYSLSLMARNLGKILIEGKRILKFGGSMLIVEVTSRFERNEKKFIGKMERIGFKLRSNIALKPNGYFTFFYFTKIDSKLDYSKSCLNIKLKPCTYKSR